MAAARRDDGQDAFEQQEVPDGLRIIAFISQHQAGAFDIKRAKRGDGAVI